MKPTKIIFSKTIITFSWLAFFFHFNSPAFAQESALERLTANNYNVLSGRVHEMLKFRLQGLKKCDLQTRDQFLATFNALPAYTNEKQVVEHTLELYYQTYQTTSSCKKDLDLAELKFHTSERTKFKLFFTTIQELCVSSNTVESLYNKEWCNNDFKRVISELNPHCISTQINFNIKLLDNFECMVGDILIGKYLYNSFDDPEDFISDSRTFFHNYWEQAHMALSKANQVELYEIYKLNKRDTYETRRKFLATLTMLFASTSSSSPYLKGFQDYFWRTKLLKTGNSKASIDLYNDSKLLIDEYRTVHKTILSKKIQVKVLDQNIKELSRHNFMAMFLACNYKGMNKAFYNFLPLALGYSYESFDFASHLKEGTSLKASVQNFKEDTYRYKMGVKLGYSFCSSIP